MPTLTVAPHALRNAMMGSCTFNPTWACLPLTTPGGFVVKQGSDVHQIEVAEPVGEKCSRLLPPRPWLRFPRPSTTAIKRPVVLHRGGHEVIGQPPLGAPVFSPSAPFVSAEQTVAVCAARWGSCWIGAGKKRRVPGESGMASG